MYVSGRFLAVDQGNDMRMVKTLQDMDFRVEIFFQLFVQLVHIDGFDGNEAGLLLQWEA